MKGQPIHDETSFALNILKDLKNKSKSKRIKACIIITSYQISPKRKGSQPIVEILADGDIEVVEIMKEINANIPE